ncbi:MAG: PepSY domain-containing protein [Bacteroidota bacterium]
MWRYSHFALAVSSSLFVLLATLTGVFLAFEPIENKLQDFYVKGAKELTLADVIDSLRTNYDEILTLEVDANQFVAVDVFSMEEELNGKFYINPFNAQKIGDIPEKRPVFEFMTVLHRSLFLKKLGRIFVGVNSFLLLLIALTGFTLFLKRQKGIRHVFDKLVKERSPQYYHVVLGRWMLLPIIIITLTGVYLSLLRFEMIPQVEAAWIGSEKELSEEPALSPSDFEIFKNTKLAEVRSLEFPFSTEVEDFFILSLKDRELKINQITGDIVDTLRYPFVNRLSTTSFDLHTGRGSILWSIVLAIAGLNILYFMYSGALISYKRLTSKVKNKIPAEAAECVILVGSENGSTRNFGKLLQKSLLQAQKKVFIDDLNNYQAYENMEDLVVLTSTYGVGEPPANASRFLHLLPTVVQKKESQFSVVGFGSLSYPDFCQYALDVDEALSQQADFSQVQAPYLIHNQSYTSFKTWAEKWGKQKGLRLELPAQLVQKKQKTHQFTILEKQSVDDSYSETFSLLLQPSTQKFQSGDLLGIAPPSDPVERQYSIAKVDHDKILLSIKRHEKGICSNYLNDLAVGESFEGILHKNKDFHLVRNTKCVLLVGNGTGIAPYLGMMQQKSRTELHLYWGGRTAASFALYRDRIEKAMEQATLCTYQTVYSKEGGADRYVQDLLAKDAEKLVAQLEAGSYIYLCGSIAMQNGVLELLENIVQARNARPLSYFQNKGQIRMDCY